MTEMLLLCYNKKKTECVRSVTVWTVLHSEQAVHQHYIINTTLPEDFPWLPRSPPTRQKSHFHFIFPWHHEIFQLTPTQLNRQSCTDFRRLFPLHLTSVSDLSLAATSFQHLLHWRVNPHCAIADTGKWGKNIEPSSSLSGENRLWLSLYPENSYFGKIWVFTNCKAACWSATLWSLPPHQCRANL